MTTLTINLPDSLGEFLQRQVVADGHSSVEAFIQHLIREDQMRKARKKINEMLLEGINSGDPIPVTAAYWEEKERRLRELFPEGESE